MKIHQITKKIWPLKIKYNYIFFQYYFHKYIKLNIFILFARHVDGIRLRNVKFELMRPDERPDMILEDVINDDIER